IVHIFNVLLNSKEKEDQVATVRQKCLNCFKGPNLIKTMVALVCIGVLVQQKYNLYSHPRYTSTWREFNFSHIPLDQLWKEITYDQDECTNRHVWHEVGKDVGCSGPWMESNLPYCDNFEDMRLLISSYITKHEEHQHEGCPRICRALLYNAFVTDRQKDYIWDNQAKSTSTLTT
ncbi:unnamed protein product, partial [Leptidea sinapis]